MTDEGRIAEVWAGLGQKCWKNTRYNIVYTIIHSRRRYDIFSGTLAFEAKYSWEDG